MEEKMYEYALKLVKGDDVIGVFKDLEKVLDENGMYYDLITCKEKIWHLNGDDEKLIEMAKLYRNEVNNCEMAYLINLLYIFRTNRDLYEELVSSLDGKGCEGLNPGFDENTDKFSELWLIADRYAGLKYIVNYFYSRKKYDEILKLTSNFRELKKIAEDYIKNHPDCDKSDCEHIEECDIEISDMLSSNGENISINKLAIDFNKQNEIAYLNILDEYFKSRNENEAVEFYNEKYRKVFEKEKKESFIKVMWDISYNYYLKYDFFKSLEIQKMILDYENEHMNGEKE